MRRAIYIEENRAYTIKAKLAYQGSAFSGFARQPGQLTVQGELEQALELLYKRFIEITCAGRTDAGVHAREQVISFDLLDGEYRERNLDTLKRSLNALIDNNIAILSIEEEALGFSARFDACAREYRYFIYTGKERPVLVSDLVWHVPASLDIGAMQEAAAYFLGEHDFKSFCTAVSAEGKPTHRNIMSLTITDEQLMGTPVMVVTVIGNAFLHSMVRTLVGTLVEVGKGKREPSWIKEVLAACDRRAAGETAPAHGLCFWQVYYKSV